MYMCTCSYDYSSVLHVSLLLMAVPIEQLQQTYRMFQSSHLIQDTAQSPDITAENTHTHTHTD